MDNADIWSVISSFCSLNDLVDILCLSRSIYRITNSNHSWKERAQREFCISQINEWLESIESTYSNSQDDYKTIYRIFRTSIIGEYDICGYHDASSTFYRYNCEVDFRKTLDCDKRVTELLFRQHDHPNISNMSPVIKYASGYCYDSSSGVKIRFNDTYIVRMGRFMSFFQEWAPGHATVSVSEHIVTEKGVHISRGIFTDNLDQSGTFIMVKLDEQLHGFEDQFPKTIKLSNEYLQELVVKHLLSQPNLQKAASDSLFFPLLFENKNSNYLMTFTPYYEEKQRQKNMGQKLTIGIRTPVVRKAMFTLSSFERGLGTGEGYFFVTTEEDKEKNKLVIGKQKSFKVLFVHFRNYYAFAFFNNSNNNNDDVDKNKKNIELCSLCRPERLINLDHGGGKGSVLSRRLEGFTYFKKDEGIIDFLTIEKRV